jgi:catechol 2,3-dioxygenase-like lactoylglutathione lyase family enzyme
MLGHIGLTINHKQDIKDFYKDLLGMREIKNFAIPQRISQQVFQINQSNSIVTLAKDNLVIELFLSEKQSSPVYNHLGIYQDNRQSFINRVKDKGYPVNIIQRENKNDLIFIEDNSGNKFEIAEIPE